MRLAVLKERREGETRVAATPETVKKLIALGLSVAVEAGAGVHSALPDADYAAAGAEVVGDAEMALAGAGVVFAVQAPDGAARAALPRGALLVCTAGAHADPGLAPAMAAAGVDLAAMELLPRITRAQSMDVLSSQANLAGFRAVVEAAAAFERGFPMMMTAAGTVPPARVFIIGAGVAGLQAIATARRLGGIVSATDVRPTSREEVRSLGATFVGVDSEQAAQTAGGYAKEMTDAFRQKQAELMGHDGRQERHRHLHRAGDGPPRADHRDARDGGVDAAGQRDRRPGGGGRRQLRGRRSRAAASSPRTA